jgi:hypothetical protein
MEESALQCAFLAEKEGFEPSSKLRRSKMLFFLLQRIFKVDISYILVKEKSQFGFCLEDFWKLFYDLLKMREETK